MKDWDLNYVNVNAWDGEPLQVDFHFKTPTRKVKDKRVVTGTAFTVREYEEVTEASADRLQKLLVSGRYTQRRTFFYSEGIILEFEEKK